MARRRGCGEAHRSSLLGWQDCELSPLPEESRKAFLLNLYHLMINTAYLLLGPPSSSLKAVSYFNAFAYHVDDEARQPLSSVLSLSVALGLASVALSGIIVATLDPTLSYRLSAPPFRLSASWVSLFFMYSSIVYVVFSIPVGWAVDLHEPVHLGARR